MNLDREHPRRPVHIALGANLGDPRAALEAALRALDEHPRVAVVAASSLHATAPAETDIPQPDYVNGAATLETDCSPRDLLAVLMGVERALGRDRADPRRNAPRTIDLDLLLYGDTVLETADLTQPHPRMHSRAFVLEPLAEIAPDAVHPTTGKTVRELLAGLERPEPTNA